MPLAWPALLTQEDGNGATKRNTHVSGGDSVTVFSGDANIKGAVIAGGKVIADIGGDLDIESRQDTARFDSKSQSASMSGMAGWVPSVSASCSQSAIWRRLCQRAGAKRTSFFICRCRRNRIYRTHQHSDRIPHWCQRLSHQELQNEMGSY